ncbi:MAG: ferrochelatase [Gammaproteobacteria bacterium]|nr:ferrochelatase [Gammaproteobacteria bacterium]
MENRAVLLTNLGSPDRADIPSVRKYLNQFLMDPYVIQLPWVLRRLIVGLFVLPFRPKASAQAYQSVWWEEGAPLTVLSQRLLEAVRSKTEVPVAMAMRYGSQGIEEQILALANTDGIEEILLIPLYPHYAESTVKTTVEEVKSIIKHNNINVILDVIKPFYREQGYIDALLASAVPWINEDNDFDHVLFSYHGLPELHITRADPTGSHCLQRPDCCQVASPAHATCYRHQVLRTTECFVEKAGLKPEQYSVAFQSRLGRAKWLAPSTVQTLEELAQSGVKKLLVICPAFVTDCLETLEEIELRGSEVFVQAGGESLTLIPCLNDHEQWVSVVSKWCEDYQV